MHYNNNNINNNQYQYYQANPNMQYQQTYQPPNMNTSQSNLNVVINLDSDETVYESFPCEPLLQQNKPNPYQVNYSQQLSSYQINPNLSYAPNAGFQNSGYQQVSQTKVTKPKSNFVDYYSKEVTNELLKRTSLIGNYNEESTTFDDYFEKHIEKFFTPEIHEITFYFSPGYIHGLHFCYRDPWGKYDKETYKGNVQLPKHINPKECQSTKLTFEYDDYPKEMYVEGDAIINYVKIVSMKGKKMEVGKKVGLDNLENQIPEMARMLGVGGSFTSCLTSLYFYYL